MSTSIRRVGNAPTLRDGSVMPYSRACCANGFLFRSGRLPFSADGTIVQGDVEAQTSQVMTNLLAVLAAAGCSLCDVVKVTAWLTDIDHFAAFNEADHSFFDGEFPARSTTGGSQLAFGALVEIEAIAVKRDR